MTQISIGGQLFSPKKLQSIDAKYGPYNNIQEALEMLGPDNMDVLCYGLTVGIVQSDGNIKDYVITKLEGTNTITVNNFKEKYQNSTIYKGVCNTPSNNKNKVVSIPNFAISNDRKPKDSTQLLLTLSYGHVESNMYLNINNLGNVQVYHNNDDVIKNIQSNKVLYMVYESDVNKWNIINNPEQVGLYWT